MRYRGHYLTYYYDSIKSTVIREQHLQMPTRIPTYIVPFFFIYIFPMSATTELMSCKDLMRYSPYITVQCRLQ